MSYHFIFTEWFDRNLKFLHKHNLTLPADFEAFLRDFEAEAHPVIPGTGGARKARMKAKTRGKRGGYRVIYYFVTSDQEVWLITIYDKVQQENLSAADTARVLKIIETIQTAK
jgi:mRNA-degrading endonuclease RelE of RelBE toxin-antitoxin system